MKARIEKKLSKRLVEIAPTFFSDAWIFRDGPTELAHEQGSRVSGIYCVGGGRDYYGEENEVYTVWRHWVLTWMWFSDFPPNPGGPFPPDTGNFKPTAAALLRIAARAEMKLRASKARRGEL